ncbi:MAG: hypothetical protein IPI67_26735 [Myxococcales bacterium]|nr:hypothetical protein [Myxococcales bacterium]
MQRRRQAEPADLVTIAQAEELLAASVPMLQRWDESGKCRGPRQPLASYRAHLRDDILKLGRRLVEGERAA